MSRRNGPKLDLKLNISPPRVNNPRVESPSRSATVSPTSPPSSCVSSEKDVGTNSDEATSSAFLAGCQRCLLYVMVSENDPKCPQCQSTVLLDLHSDTATSSTTTTKTRKSR